MQEPVVDEAEVSEPEEDLDYRPDYLEDVSSHASQTFVPPAKFDRRAFEFPPELKDAAALLRLLRLGNEPFTRNQQSQIVETVHQLFRQHGLDGIPSSLKELETIEKDLVFGSMKKECLVHHSLSSFSNSSQ